jgi:transcription elongation factor SPT6
MYMIVGESPLTIYKGLFLPVNIVKDIVRDDETCTVKKCKLDNGLDGFINVKNSDENIFAGLGEGMVVNAKIDNIEYDKFSVSLAVRKECIEESEALDRVGGSYRPYFRFILDKDFRSKSQVSLKNRFGVEGKYEIRHITHPKFKNCTLTQAINELQDREVGEYIIRPSSLGKNYLTLSWKFF